MKIQILIILIIFLLNTGFAETITTLSDGTDTKEITIDGKHIEYLEIPNDVIITSAGMDLAGFSQKPGAETIITEIDKYKSSYHPYQTDFCIVKNHKFNKIKHAYAAF